MSSELISVIIPVYNSAAELPRCIDSVLAQDYPDIEIILIDDGSTDDSPAICDRYAASNSRIKAYHQPNGKAARARNAGIEKATGKYFLFVDSDDYIDPVMCSEMYEEIKDPSISFVQCGMYMTEGEGNTREIIRDQRTVFDAHDAMLSFFSKAGDITGSFSDKLIRRELFDRGLRMDARIGNEDTEIIPRLIDMSDKIVLMNRAYYHYVKRDNSCSSYNRFNLRIYSFIPSLFKFKKMCKERYPDLVPWYGFYLLSTYDGMYQYLSHCDDGRLYPKHKIVLRFKSFIWCIKCAFYKAIREQRSMKLKEYLIRAVLGER